MARDYLLRLIEQMAALFAGVIAKKGAGQLREAGTELDSLCVQTIGLDLPRLKGSSPEAVAQRLAAAGGLRHVRAITLAEVLLQDAELLDPNPDGRPLGAGEVHAFCLLADSIPALSRDEQAFYRVKLNSLASRLGDLRAHPYLQARL